MAADGFSLNPPSEPTLEPPALLDWICMFSFPVRSVMTSSLLFPLWQVNGVPAAFAHRQHGLLAHAVAAVGLRRQRAGIQSRLRR